MSAKEVHKHHFVLKDELVLLHQHRSEKGKMKYVNTTGRDILKQRVCACGAKETYDLERSTS